MSAAIDRLRELKPDLVISSILRFNYPARSSDASPVTQGGLYVTGIVGTLFVTFNIFAITMVLQYKKVGRWREYLAGEKTYMILSLFAKTLLAWQVFTGTLRPGG